MSGAHLRLVPPHDDGAEEGGPAEESLVPPHDLNAEAAVLASCMLVPAALERTVDLLRPEHFFSLANARIWEAIRDLAVARTPVDLVTVRSCLEERDLLHKIGGATYLGQLVEETPAVANPAAYAETVLERWEDRELIATCQRIAAEGCRPTAAYQARVRGRQELPEGVRERDAWRAMARADLGRVTAPRTRATGRQIGYVVEQARQRVIAMRSGAAVGVPYGFTRLDPLGLLGRKRQTIIAGRPGMGKTALGFQICVNVASTPLDHRMIGEAVYIASWEMPAELLLFRQACTDAYVDFHKVERGRADDDELERIAASLARLKALPIIIDDQKCTTAELGARVKAAKEMYEAGKARDSEGNLLPRCRMGLVSVDYVQLGIDGADHPRADKKAVIGRTSKGLVEHVAKGCDVATLVLAMLKRVEAATDGKVRAPILDDLKESGEIEEDADNVLLIHRPQYYLRKKCPAELRNVAEIIPAKGRYGMPEGSLKLGFYAGRFSDQLPAAARGEPHYEDTDDDR